MVDRETTSLTHMRESLTPTQVESFLRNPTSAFQRGTEVASHMGLPVEHFETAPTTEDGKKPDLDRIRGRYIELGWRSLEGRPPTSGNVISFARALSLLHRVGALNIHGLNEEQKVLSTGDKIDSDGNLRPDKFAGRKTYSAQWQSRLEMVRSRIATSLYGDAVPEEIQGFLDDSERYRKDFLTGETPTEAVLAHGNADIQQTVFKTVEDEEKAVPYNLRHARITDRPIAIVGDMGNAWARLVQNGAEADDIDWGEYSPPEGSERDLGLYFLTCAIDSTPESEREEYVRLLAQAVASTSVSLCSYMDAERGHFNDSRKVAQAKNWLEKGATHLSFLEGLVREIPSKETGESTV